MRVRAGALMGTVILGAVSTSFIAHAGCPNACELTVEQPSLEPDLSCAKLEVSSKSCDCGMDLQVTNDCTTAIDAVDFVFDQCWLSSPPDWDEFDEDCSVIEPSKTVRIVVELTEVGEQETSFHLQSNGGDYALKVRSNVSSFNDGGSCSMAGPRGAGGTSAWFLCAMLASLGVIRRATQLRLSTFPSPRAGRPHSKAPESPTSSH